MIYLSLGRGMIRNPTAVVYISIFSISAYIGNTSRQQSSGWENVRVLTCGNSSFKYGAYQVTKK
jgi:hypothetical protein